MAMILTAHQPLYLPWLGFFQKVAMSDIFCLWEDVQFSPNDFIQRNRIKNPNGVMWLTVPILTKDHREKTINEMYIDNSQKWQRVHWNSMLIAYGKKAPYFNSYNDFFEDTYKRRWDKIADLDEHLLRYILKELGISVDFIKASDQNFEGKKSDRVLDMCVKLGVGAYIFGETGKEYANVEEFKNKGIKIHFQNYKHPVYPQLYGDFVSNLSIIDLLFSFGEKSHDILVKNNPSKDDLKKLLTL